MEFIDDDWDSQPRARVVHSRANANANANANSTNSSATASDASRSLPHTAACAAAAVLLLAAAYSLHAAYQVFASILIWIASSLLLAPFAPSSATGGDVSVGRGSLLPEQETSEDPTPEPAPTSRRGRRQNAAPPPPKPSDPIAPPVQTPPPLKETKAAGSAVADGGEREENVGEWTDQEMELLRRQMVKHPAGEPQRWEKIASVFGGRRTPESVIRAAKSGGAAAAAGGSFEQFLRKRKPLDPRAEAADADAGGNAGGGEGGDGGWSAGDDRALLNALKEFPKDSAMRWEKVAAAVPGKTKAACMKRVTELKRDFRSSKTSSDAAQ